MSKYVKIETNDLIIFLNYLLEHAEPCYCNECKIMIKRFLERNNIKYE